MTLRRRFAMHMRMQHGSTVGHEIFEDDTGKVVGAVSTFTPKNRHVALKHPARVVYTLTVDGSNREFATAKEFIAAYEGHKAK